MKTIIIVAALILMSSLTPGFAGEQSATETGTIKKTSHGFGTAAHRAGFGEPERGPNRHHRSHHHAKAARKLCTTC